MESVFENEIYLSSRRVKFILPEVLVNKLDLAIACKTIEGKILVLTSDDCMEGKCGCLDESPFIEIRLDAAKGIESIEIAHLERFSELYFCILPSDYSEQKGTTRLEVKLYDGEDKDWQLPLDFSWNGQVCLAAKLENNSFMGARFSRVNRMLDANMLKKMLPGAEEIIKRLNSSGRQQQNKKTRKALDSPKISQSEKKPDRKVGGSIVFSFLLTGMRVFFNIIFSILRMTLSNPLILAGLVLTGGVLYALNHFSVISVDTWPLMNKLFPPPKNEIDITIHTPSPIDKLFTGFAVVRIVDVDYVDEMKREVPSGYCYHEYEVGFGYRDINVGVFNKYEQPACAGNNDALPHPQILSVNPISSEFTGTYGRAECEKWDVRPAIRERKIRVKLLEQEQLQKIRKKGREVLGSYIRIYCDILPVSVDHIELETK